MGFFAPALLALGIFIQAVGVHAANSQECITSLDMNKDYFDSKVKSDTASYFSVQYKKYYKIVTNTDENEVYVLYQCGAPQPTDDSIPTGAKFFSVPVKKVGVLSTTIIPYLEMLGARSTIKAVSNPSYVTSPCIQSGIANSQIEDLASGNETLYAEQVGNLDIVFGDYQKNNNTKILVSSETADPGPLNRAEWLEFYSTFFNLEDVANNLTSTINANYGCFKANAQTAQFQGSSKRPVVAWTTMNTWGDNPLPFEVSNAAYKKALTTDAGGIFFEPSVRAYANATAFKAAVASVDLLIDDTYEASSWEDVLSAYGLAETDDLPFVKNRAIYRYDRVKSAAGGFDFLESGVPMADAALQDMIRAILGDKFNYEPGTAMNWLRNIGNKEVVVIASASSCPSDVFSTKLQDVAAKCSSQTLTADANSDSFGTAAPNVMFTVTTAVISTVLRFVL